MNVHKMLRFCVKKLKVYILFFRMLFRRDGFTHEYRPWKNGKPNGGGFYPNFEKKISRKDILFVTELTTIYKRGDECQRLLTRKYLEKLPRRSVVQPFQILLWQLSGQNIRHGTRHELGSKDYDLMFKIFDRIRQWINDFSLLAYTLYASSFSGAACRNL